MSSPHILFAAYQSGRGSNGGMESATRIFEALANDFRWTLLTNRETARTARWRAGRAEVKLFAFDEEARPSRRLWQLGLTTARAVAPARRADVLHANDIRALRILRPVAQMTRRPLAFTLRDTKPPEEQYPDHWHRAVRKLDALVTLSDDMARFVGDRLPIAQDRRHTIGSIVDLDAFSPPTVQERKALRAKLGIAPGEIAIVMAAGVFAKKRQLEVIRLVAPQLLDLPVRFHMVGDFAPETELYARTCAAVVEELGFSERVLFHGFRPDVADWLAAADIVLVASEREGLARCMIEAMACGTPVVSVDVSSAHEMLLRTGAGLVTGADDWQGLAQALRVLAADPDRRTAMGRAGRATAEARFSSAQVAQAWRQLYLGLAR
ncbi:glycosyltransferase [Sphingobium lignivorans]|uniref:Glycosyltransferase involved in cell wall biosynthesis n=1 Tax=Sphingobium lignivorans TaxID=2735886 RepID=A0ABR6NF08_9SPHN|nr:glycosyltransferase involved in cell wall biosynthesis [Sphingobium lignivorans]